MSKNRDFLSVMLVVLFLVLLMALVLPNFEGKPFVDYVVSVLLVFVFCVFIFYKIIVRKRRMWRAVKLRSGEKILFEQEGTKLLSLAGNGSASEQRPINYLLKATNFRLFFLDKSGVAIHLVIDFVDSPKNSFFKALATGVVEAKRSGLTVKGGLVRVEIPGLPGGLRMEFEVRDTAKLKLLTRIK